MHVWRTRHNWEPGDLHLCLYLAQVSVGSHLRACAPCEQEGLVRRMCRHLFTRISAEMAGSAGAESIHPQGSVASFSVT